jgi:hypothetical protein
VKKGNAGKLPNYPFAYGSAGILAGKFRSMATGKRRMPEIAVFRIRRLNAPGV